MKVGVISDTHAPRRGAMPAAVRKAFEGVELVLHAGDVCTPRLLDELAAIAPVHCATGNCDPAEVTRWGARPTVELELDGVGVAMLHDAGPAERRAARMRRRFPDADVVVFGHSHVPLVERAEGLLLLNPGSAMDRRRAPHHTVALLHIADGGASAELVQLD